nr:MAG TPA: hypothetical protein [Caudoviricetes sp.]
MVSPYDHVGWPPRLGGLRSWKHGKPLSRACARWLRTT